MIITIDGKKYKFVRDAAIERGVAYMTFYMWLYRHPDIPRIKHGGSVLVDSEYVAQYTKSR